MGFGRDGSSCAYPLSIVGEKFLWLRATLIWLPGLLILFLAMKLLSTVEGEFRIYKGIGQESWSKRGCPIPFTLTPVQLERQLHKPSFSVMGRLDTFAMLRNLLLRLNGLLDDRFVLSTQFFRRVNLGLFDLFFFEIILPNHVVCNAGFGNWKNDFVWGFPFNVEDDRLGPQIVSYISSNRQRQEVQHVKESVCRL